MPTHYVLSPHWSIDHAIQTTEKPISLNPHYPGWFHFVFFLNHYVKGEFDAALNEACQIRAPEFYVDPLSIAVALGQLGQLQKAETALKDLLSLIPDFPGNRCFYPETSSTCSNNKVDMKLDIAIESLQFIGRSMAAQGFRKKVMSPHTAKNNPWQR